MASTNIANVLGIIKDLEGLVADTSKEMLGTKVTTILRTHAIVGAGTGLIPIPGVDIAAMIANTWTMYVRINEVIGISFSENALKSIATGIGTNLITIIPGLAIAKLGGFISKFIPGVGTAVGMAVDASVNYAIVYVMGVVYLKAITAILKNKTPLTEESLHDATKTTLQDKEFVRNVYSTAKEQHKEEKQ